MSTTRPEGAENPSISRSRCGETGGGEAEWSVTHPHTHVKIRAHIDVQYTDTLTNADKQTDTQTQNKYSVNSI